MTPSQLAVFCLILGCGILTLLTFLHSKYFFKSSIVIYSVHTKALKLCEWCYYCLHSMF
ncbi:rCG43084, isoform CRA_a [Rattus norvegicus]|uniref:RCG43084, isoform CRA_a n=1 Tax=Rattus norvegicus TaxID=10116 RepID=A6IWC4_RAT|nr:rCG43084, isoform CRA_a [Rattus norvegicus]